MTGLLLGSIAHNGQATVEQRLAQCVRVNGDGHCGLFPTLDLRVVADDGYAWFGSPYTSQCQWLSTRVGDGEGGGGFLCGEHQFVGTHLDDGGLLACFLAQLGEVVQHLCHHLDVGHARQSGSAGTQRLTHHGQCVGVQSPQRRLARVEENSYCTHCTRWQGVRCGSGLDVWLAS